MTFYEQELRKIVGEEYPDATYVGRACYVRLDEMNRAKLCFIATNISNHYDALRMTILNRQDGVVDQLTVRFSDVLGTKQVNNPHFRNGVEPHIWEYQGRPEWYAYHPGSQDYRMLTKSVMSYLDIFMEMEQTESQQWQQTMR